MESRECPTAIIMATEAILGKLFSHETVANHPSPSSLNFRFDGSGAGGICAGPRTISVNVHQTRNVTTMIVVICIMRSALWLDSGRPLMLHHQKYAVTRTANVTANRFGGT